MNPWICAGQLTGERTDVGIFVNVDTSIVCRLFKDLVLFFHYFTDVRKSEVPICVYIRRYCRGRCL